MDELFQAQSKSSRLEARCNDLEAENAALRENLNDIQEVHDRIMAEKCPGDEVHCTCVPVLRTELLKIANALGSLKDVGRLPEALKSVLSSYRNRAEKSELKLARLEAKNSALIGANENLNATIEELVNKAIADAKE